MIAWAKMPSVHDSAQRVVVPDFRLIGIVLYKNLRVLKTIAGGVIIILCKEKFWVKRLLLCVSCSSKNVLYMYTLPFAVLNLHVLLQYVNNCTILYNSPLSGPGGRTVLRNAKTPLNCIVFARKIFRFIPTFSSLDWQQHQQCSLFKDLTLNPGTEMQRAKLLMEAINSVRMLVIEMQGFSNNCQKNNDNSILGGKRIRQA